MLQSLGSRLLMTLLWLGLGLRLGFVAASPAPNPFSMPLHMKMNSLALPYQGHQLWEIIFKDVEENGIPNPPHHYDILFNLQEEGRINLWNSRNSLFSLPPQQMNLVQQRLRKEDLDWRVIHRDISLLIRNQNSNDVDNDNDNQFGGSEGEDDEDVDSSLKQQHPIVVTPPPQHHKTANLKFHSSYHPQPEIYSFFKDLQGRFPDLVEEFELGVTGEGRSVMGWRVGNSSSSFQSSSSGTGDSSSGKQASTSSISFLNQFTSLFSSKDTQTTITSKESREFLFHGSIHAREWVGPALLSYMYEHLLLLHSSKDPSILQLLDVDGFTFSFVPVLNLDGYAFTWGEDRMWRKNREDTGTFFCVGVDMNRNFDANFGGPGASSSPCSEAYHGPSAFSAHESKMIRDYLLSRGPLLGYIDWHAFSQLWMYPFGSPCGKEAGNGWDEKWEKVSKAGVKALKKVHGTSFTSGPICKTIYEASGSSVDWAFEGGGVKYPFAIELRDLGKYGFLLPSRYILPSGEETLSGLLAMLEEIKVQEGM